MDLLPGNKKENEEISRKSSSYLNFSQEEYTDSTPETNSQEPQNKNVVTRVLTEVYTDISQLNKKTWTSMLFLCIYPALFIGLSILLGTAIILYRFDGVIPAEKSFLEFLDMKYYITSVAFVFYIFITYYITMTAMRSHFNISTLATVVKTVFITISSVLACSVFSYMFIAFTISMLSASMRIFNFLYPPLAIIVFTLIVSFIFSFFLWRLRKELKEDAVINKNKYVHRVKCILFTILLIISAIMILGGIFAIIMNLIYGKTFTYHLCHMITHVHMGIEAKPMILKNFPKL
ncbi:hypothetical protein NEFER03_1545 [Nematocida sp. LUAm3]|nr:hypothetical protein NEFER03_1545 [Nematocida sp. LUAm3]KAI5174578.1 hypothetical protein NEFER02_0699 [Nematocida sp. LUAm2]KAI5178016.1 hypothetical protein NEFER01_1198 [Nematocida sp. LUAm1]